jgi:hypothetical protein
MVGDAVVRRRQQQPRARDLVGRLVGPGRSKGLPQDRDGVPSLVSGQEDSAPGLEGCCGEPGRAVGVGSGRELAAPRPCLFPISPGECHLDGGRQEPRPRGRIAFGRRQRRTDRGGCCLDISRGEPEQGEARLWDPPQAVCFAVRVLGAVEVPTSTPQLADEVVGFCDDVGVDVLQGPDDVHGLPLGVIPGATYLQHLRPVQATDPQERSSSGHAVAPA